MLSLAKCFDCFQRMKLLIQILPQILTLTFKYSISVEAYNRQCPHRSQMKFHATSVCVGYPLENYACLYVSGTNDSVESCTDVVADYAAPGKRYVLKENPHTEYCSIYKYQPYKLWSNRSSDCDFLRSECSEIGQIMCNIGTTITDLTCRCNHRKGYAFITTPRNGSFCMPAEEDCSCFLKICEENKILAPDYNCKPSQYSIEHIPCSTLPDQDHQQVNASLPDYTVHIEERRNIFTITHLVDTIIITIIIIIICLVGIIYIAYNSFYTPLDTVEVFTNKIQRNYKKLKTSINQQTEDQLVINGFLSKEQKDNFKHKDEILLFIARNSRAILKTYRRKSLKCVSKHDELIGKILKTDFIDLIDLPKPSDIELDNQKKHLERHEEQLLDLLDGKTLVDDFVENFIFDLSDLEEIIKKSTFTDRNKCFLEKVKNKLPAGTYCLLQKILNMRNERTAIELLDLSVVLIPHLAMILCVINKNMKDTTACVQLEIKFNEHDIKTYAAMECGYKKCDTILLHELSLCSMHTVTKNGPVYKPLRCLNANTLHDFVSSGSLAKMVEKVICEDYSMSKISSGKHSVDVVLNIDLSMENSRAVKEFTTKTNEASSNVITVNKTFIMKEMDSLMALEVLGRSHCNFSHISGDRLQKLPFIIKILENEPEKYLDDLLKGLQEKKEMEGLCLRLLNSRKIFSVNIAEKDLVANLLQHYYDDVVKILKVDELYILIIDELKERKIRSQLDEEGPISTTKDQDLDEIVYNLITTVIRKGRNAMLNFVDILLKNDQEVIALNLLKKVPNRNSMEKRDKEKHPLIQMESLDNDKLLHAHYELTIPVTEDLTSTSGTS